MRIVLIYPPLADPTQPYPALPALAAYLRMKGKHESVQWDANIGFVHSVLTRECMTVAIDNVEERLERFHQHPERILTARDEYGLLVQAALKAPFVLEGIEGAVKELQKRECYQDLGRLDGVRRLMHEALAILSAASFPVSLSFFNTPAQTLDTPDALLRWARDETCNPFRAFATSILTGLKALTPGAVGISVSFRSQVLGAATLALLIRREMPEVPIIIGGNLVSVWQERWQELGGLFECCDYLVPFEGETALNDLLTMLASGARLDGVPNLIYRERGEIKRTSAVVEDLNLLPTPYYAGLPLDQYLAQDTVFSLTTSRGCYWGQCSFCAVSPAMRLKHRRRSAARIADDIRTISEAYGGRYVTFTDDCVSPAALGQIAAAVGECGRKLCWQAEVRFESALTGDLLAKLGAAGCVNLVFGLESFSRRVRDLMRKGTTDEDIERILAECRRLGIAFNLQFFFGFPGERPEEADETLSFVLSQAHGAATFSFGTFELQKGSTVERMPEAYGVARVCRDTGPLAVKFDYEPTPSHAVTMRERLHGLLSERMTYLHTGLSMNAQTLFLLDACGPDGLADLYKPSANAAEGTKIDSKVAGLRDRRLRRSPSLHLGMFFPLDRSDPASYTETADSRQVLAYVYERDETLAISPVAVWLLQQLDGSQTLAEFLASLPEEVVDLTETLMDASAELYQRRLLVSVPSDRPQSATCASTATDSGAQTAPS